MFKFALAAAVLATACMPLAAVAQPYDDQGGGYSDQGSQSDDSDQGARDNGDDRGDRTSDRNDQTYDQGDRNSDRGDDQDYSRRHRDADHPDQRFTGRVGASWRDADGRRCSWREVTFHDDDGAQAFKWITVCRHED